MDIINLIFACLAVPALFVGIMWGMGRLMEYLQAERPPAPRTPSEPDDIRSTAVFSFRDKVNSQAEFDRVIYEVAGAVLDAMVQQGYEMSKINRHGSETTQAVYIGNRKFLLVFACQRAGGAYEWVMWVDAFPSFIDRMLQRVPALDDSKGLRRLLLTLDGALKAADGVSQLSWHKKHILSHENLTSACDMPCSA